MKNFIFYFLGGSMAQAKGSSVEDAFTSAGYGAGAVRALDFYEQSEKSNYKYDTVKKDWIKQDEKQSF